MENSDVRKYLHDLNNALNAAKINAYLLRRMHGDLLDKETADGLDAGVCTMRNGWSGSFTTGCMRRRARVRQRGQRRRFDSDKLTQNHNKTI